MTPLKPLAVLPTHEVATPRRQACSRRMRHGPGFAPRLLHLGEPIRSLTGTVSARYCDIDLDGFFASAEQHLLPDPGFVGVLTDSGR